MPYFNNQHKAVNPSTGGTYGTTPKKPLVPKAPTAVKPLVAKPTTVRPTTIKPAAPTTTKTAYTGASGSTPYSSAYKAAEAKGDYQGMMAAASNADKWRKSQGMAASNTNLINTLKVKNEAASIGVNPNDINAGYMKSRAAGNMSAYDYNSGIPTTGQANYDKVSYDLNDVQKAYEDTREIEPQGVRYNKPSNFDYSKAIRGWQDSSLTSQLSQLRQAYDQSRAGINMQIPQVQQMMQDYRSQNETNYQGELQKLYNNMEASGGYRGGENISGQVALGAARGQNLTNINTNELNKIAELYNSLNNINQQESAAEAQAKAATDAEALEKIIQASQYMSNMGEQQRQFDTGQQNWQQNFDLEKAYRDAGLTGYYGGQQTMEGQSQSGALRNQQIQNEILALQLQNLPAQTKLQLQDLQNKVKAGTLDYSTAQAQLSLLKAQTAAQGRRYEGSASNPTSPNYNYRTDGAWKQNWDYIDSDPMSAYKSIQQNYTQIVNSYGEAGAQALLNKSIMRLNLSSGGR